MKTPDHRFRKVIVVLGVNIFISWLIGHAYKDLLIRHLSAQTYYQLIVFISLMIAPSVSVLYGAHIKYRLSSKEKKLRDKLDEDVINQLEGEEKEYAESLINPNIEISEQLRSLKAEREAFENSK